MSVVDGVHEARISTSPDGARSEIPPKDSDAVRVTVPDSA